MTRRNERIVIESTSLHQIGIFIAKEKHNRILLVCLPTTKEGGGCKKVSYHLHFHMIVVKPPIIRYSKRKVAVVP